jgi:predicted Zn-dependent protease
MAARAAQGGLARACAGAARKVAVAALAGIIAVTGSLPPAAAQPRGGGVPIVRDTETENLMRDYAAPILRAAGLTQQNVQIVLINDRSFNAFVVDGRRIFMNIGTLMDATTPNQVIGVIAHEAGHIAGGHLARLRERLKDMETLAILALLLGVGAVAGAAATNRREIGSVAGPAMTAPMEALRRSFLAYQRSEEQAADRAAVTFLNQTGQSPRGMLETFQRFADQVMFTARYVDPYAQSHPMPRERVIALEEAVRLSPHVDKRDPPALQARHDLMRAKLAGFTERPETVARRYPASDTSLPARYARAIAAYRHGAIDEAQRQIDALITAQPTNPHFWELKGQSLHESGRHRESVVAYRRAASMLPQAPLVRIALAQSLLALNDNGVLDEAVNLLRNALQREPDMPGAFTQLAIAYGRKGDGANADLAAAQAALAAGEVQTARELAARAKTRFPTGSPGWLRADDIVNTRPPTPRG